MKKTTITLEQLRERLLKEENLVWVFYQCLNRTDQEDQETGHFRLSGSNAWTGDWRHPPKVKYDRIAHWNDKSQILYIGKKSNKEPKPSENGGNTWLIPMSEVEAFKVSTKFESSRNLKELIPESRSHITENLTYWPKDAKFYHALEKDIKKK